MLNQCRLKNLFVWIIIERVSDQVLLLEKVLELVAGLHVTQWCYIAQYCQYFTGMSNLVLS